MKVGLNTVVTVSFSVYDAQGELIEEAKRPVSYLQGGADGFFPRIEEALLGKEVGYSAHLHLEPEDAFGEYDSDLVRVEPKSRFPEPLEVGMQFEGIPEDAQEEGDEAVIFTVTDIADGQVVLDGNHPYAGVALHFQIQVLGVRAATEDEIEMGRAESDDEDDDEEAYEGPVLGPKLLH